MNAYIYDNIIVTKQNTTQLWAGIMTLHQSTRNMHQQVHIFMMIADVPMTKGCQAISKDYDDLVITTMSRMPYHTIYHTTTIFQQLNKNGSKEVRAPFY